MVLSAFLDHPGEELHGFGLLTDTGLRSGTLYPLLIRLESLGWLGSRWNEDDAPGPRRRLYRLTETGQIEAREMLARPGSGKRGKTDVPPITAPKAVLQ